MCISDATCYLYYYLLSDYAFGVGQNCGFGYKTWKGVIDAWFNERKFFTYGVKNDLPKVGHFTQVGLPVHVTNMCLRKLHYNYVHMEHNPLAFIILESTSKVQRSFVGVSEN